MSTSSNESFVVVSKESQDDDGNLVTKMFRPLVTFENVLESYPLELDLVVRVVVDKTHSETPGDKIVLLPVAWKSVDEAISVGEKYNNVVKFPLGKLPGEEEICQLCYYADENRGVLGLSTPFKLEHYSEERLLEFIDRQEYMALFKTFEAGVARLNISGETVDSDVQNENSDGNNLQLVQKVTTEVLKHITKKWTNEKECLLKEMKALKESVVKLEEKVQDTSDSDSSDSENTLGGSRIKDIPVIYGITPTYRRLEQKALLIRLSHTLRLIPCFHWIVVEDAEDRSQVVSDVLTKSGLSFTHLTALSPSYERELRDDKEHVVQRNAAMKWLRQNKKSTGIVYFMDEYKIYDLEIFNEMRSIQKVGVWPVGLAGGLLAEKPLVDTKTGRVVGWNSRYRTDRRFPIDAIGCAINLRCLLEHPEAVFQLEVEPALRLSAFLSKLVSVKELEPRANNCSEVLVWHIRIKKTNE